MVIASITGVFKTVLILLGAFVLLRFLGQLMMAKRNLEEERQLNKHRQEFENERSRKLKNFGKVHILSRSKKRHHHDRDGIEDVDYEDVDH